MEKNYITRCDGLDCPFRDDCKRYELYLQDKENLKYMILIMPTLTDKVCLNQIKK